MVLAAALAAVALAAWPAGADPAKAIADGRGDPRIGQLERLRDKAAGEAARERLTDEAGRALICTARWLGNDLLPGLPDDTTACRAEVSGRWAPEGFRAHDPAGWTALEADGMAAIMAAFPGWSVRDLADLDAHGTPAAVGLVKAARLVLERDIPTVPPGVWDEAEARLEGAFRLMAAIFGGRPDWWR